MMKTMKIIVLTVESDAQLRGEVAVIAAWAPPAFVYTEPYMWLEFQVCATHLKIFHIYIFSRKDHKYLNLQIKREYCIVLLFLVMLVRKVHFVSICICLLLVFFKTFSPTVGSKEKGVISLLVCFFSLNLGD